MGGFGDVSKAAGLNTLNEYLATRSYIDGFQPSIADQVVFDAVKKAPNTEYCHVLRWYNHIKSYADTKLPGVKKDISRYGGDAKASADDDADDDFELFGDDDAAPAPAPMVDLKPKKKKDKKAKSSVLFDVKPWDDETDMKELEEKVRSITMEGLIWGQGKLVDLAYGIKKLQILCVIEDEKVSTEDIEDQMRGFEDHCQSVDIAAFNKI